MEYYKFNHKGKTKYLIIIDHHNFNIYNKKMILEKKYTDVWSNVYREQLVSKSTMINDEIELAKLMLICHT